MTDKVVRLIEREVEGLGQAPAHQAPKIATLNDDRLIARVVDASDRLGAAASSLGTSLQSSLDYFGVKLDLQRFFAGHRSHYATLASNASGLMPPRYECLRRVL
jgi:hypothetical protein